MLIIQKDADAFEGFENLPVSTRMPVAALALGFCRGPVLTNAAMRMAYEEAVRDFDCCMEAFGQVHLFALIADELSCLIGVDEAIDDELVGRRYLLDDDQLEEFGRFLKLWTPFELHGDVWVKTAPTFPDPTGSAILRFR